MGFSYRVELRPTANLASHTHPVPAIEQKRAISEVTMGEDEVFGADSNIFCEKMLEEGLYPELFPLSTQSQTST